VLIDSTLTRLFDPTWKPNAIPVTFKSRRFEETILGHLLVGLFMNSDEGILSILKHPEYTGENRCLPCTGVNILIAAGLGVILAYISPFVGGVAVAVSLL